MRLSRGPDAIPTTVGEILDRRLAKTGDAPVAVAFSGGGDSLALLLAAQQWAGVRRRLIVLTVDHRLRPESAAWTAACAALAGELGLPFQDLAWMGEKPERGLPATARAARHALLAQAARQAGAGVILLGHTADDILESRRMRAEGASTPDPREWAPSPAWPEGREVFLLRPMLGLRRADLRAWLAGQGRTWIEDPANTDLSYARPRARQALSGAAAVADALPTVVPVALALATRFDPLGGLEIDRGLLREAGRPEARAFVAAACLCVGGGTRPPRGLRLDRLVDLLVGEGAWVANLSGARITAGSLGVFFHREAGDMARAGTGGLALTPGAAQVWDGRFEVSTSRQGLCLRPLAGVGARLSKPVRAALARAPAGARGSLPVVEGPDGLACPLLETVPGMTVRSLVHDRLLAACGAVERERS